MASVKVFGLLAVVLIFGGVKEILGQDVDEDVGQVWPVGISPLDSLAYWNNDDEMSEMEEEEKAQGCCMPKTWTGKLFTEIKREGRGRKPGGRALRFMEVVYADQNNRRFALDVTIPRRKKNATRISYIVLFNQTSGATVYTFCKIAKKCVKKDLKNAQFSPMCLPTNATLFGSFSLGAGSVALKAQSWGFQVRSRRAAIAGNVILTPSNCVPIIASERVYTRPHMTDDTDLDKRPQVTVVGSLYTNVATSIPDPSVFTPPSYCKSDDDDLLFDEDIDFTSITQRFITTP